MVSCDLDKEALSLYLTLINHSDSAHKYSEVDIIKMLEFLGDSIYVVFGNHVFEQSVGIPMGTNCGPLLVDLFLYSCEAEFIQIFVREKINSTQHSGISRRIN